MTSAAPQGYRTVTPWIVTAHTAKAIAFITAAFGGEEIGDRFVTESGRIDHAEMRVGDSMVMLFDSRAGWPATPALIRLFIRDVDAVYRRALDAGALTVTEPRTHAWGDRVARVRDPLGNVWWLQERVVELSPAEMGPRFGQPEYVDAMAYTQQTLDRELRSRTVPPSNKVTWFQLPADDVERAWRFYGEVFGWRADEAYSPDRQLGAIPGEIAPRDDTLRQPRVVVRVDDVDEALARITAAGGTVTVGRTDIPEIGMVYASFTDAEGNVLNVVGDL